MANLQQAEQERTVRRDHDEAGFMLLAVVVMVALVLIALAVAAPVVARDLRRDKEVESEHRQQQYLRAIRLYYLKTKSYPPSMEALEKSNNIRFLRHQWIDPLTGKADWRIIHQPKTKVKGPFGQELAGLTAGLGTAAGMASGANSSATVDPCKGGTTGLSAGFNDATANCPTSGGASAAGAPATGGAGASGPGSAFGSSGAGTSATGSGTGAGTTGSSSTSSSGGIIMGVGTSRSGDSILTPNEQSTYETWEFWYDPRIEFLTAKVTLFGGSGIGGTGTGNSGVSSTSLGGLNSLGSGSSAGANSGAAGTSSGGGTATGGIGGSASGTGGR